VDRIEIVTQPNSSDSDELEQTIALQVGKYVSEGVFVSFTQGAEDASGNIGIEVDLKHGFILELESDQRQEQGKFTLKWSKSY
jgi:translocation and assembly module TamB